MKFADPQEYKFKSNLRLYWTVWLVYLVACFIAWRAFHNFARSFHDNFPIIYMVGIWIPIMFLNLYEGKRLMAYLRQYHFEKWTELTTIPGFGSGNINGFRSVPWLFSSDTLDDPMLDVIKRNYRRFIYFTLTVFFAFPIFAFVFGI